MKNVVFKTSSHFVDRQKCPIYDGYSPQLPAGMRNYPTQYPVRGMINLALYIMIKLVYQDSILRMKTSGNLCPGISE
jgi:hypothetical protein